MASNNRSSILKYLCFFICGVLIVPQLVSCGKDSTTTSLGTVNAYLNIVNVSPNINPVNLYATYVKQGATVYRYPTPSDYFLMNIVDTPLQIRPALTTTSSQTNLISLPRSLNRNIRYTWFLTGLRTDSAFSYILTVDSGAIPPAGRSKVRMVNASPGTTGLNLTANDSLAFSKVAYKGVTAYKELTSGTYDFKFTSGAATSTILSTMKNITVLDGKLYTIYTYGLLNRTDSAAFNAGIILNTIPDKK